MRTPIPSALALRCRWPWLPVYFARSARVNVEDLALIETMAAHAVESGMAGISGVVGHDEGVSGEPLRTIEFPRIRGGKAFDTAQPWFTDLLSEIGQPSA